MNTPNKPPEQITVYNHPPKDYTNSHRSQREFRIGKQAQPAPPPAQPQTVETEKDGFFKSTLKDAFKSAVNTVVDPAIRGFLWNIWGTFTNVAGTMIWGQNANRLYGGGQTPYREISTGITSVLPVGSPALPSGQRVMTREARSNQEYLRCSKPTQEGVYAVMSKLYRALRNNGKVTLANYYEAFGEKYDFNDEAFGWTAIPENTMFAQYYDGGYHVRMPKLEVLDSDIRR
jgi:hypothetical protein